MINKTKLLLTLFPLFVFSSIILNAQTDVLKINRTNEFNMNYKSDENYIDIYIERKDKKIFNTYKNWISYSFKDKSKLFITQSKKLHTPGFLSSIFPKYFGNEDISKLEFFLYDNNTNYSELTSPYVYEYMIKIPLTQKISQSSFHKKIEIKNLLAQGKEFIPTNKLAGEQEIIVKVKFIHDSILQEYSEFETKPIKVLLNLDK